MNKRQHGSNISNNSSSSNNNNNSNNNDTRRSKSNYDGIWQPQSVPRRPTGVRYQIMTLGAAHLVVKECTNSESDYEARCRCGRQRPAASLFTSTFYPPNRTKGIMGQ